VNILLVEDDRDSREYLADFLGKHGHAVTECSNGKDALDLINNREFHMVLSDIKMPGMSGLDMLRSLSPGRYLDVVLFTGYDDVELAIEALRAGAYDYLLKPINIKELTVVVERVARHRALLPESKALHEKMDEAAEDAAKETKQELKLLKEAYAQAMGAGEVIIASEAMKKYIPAGGKISCRPYNSRINTRGDGNRQRGGGQTHPLRERRYNGSLRGYKLRGHIPGHVRKRAFRL